MTLLLLGAGSSFAQAAEPSGNSALDQYYEDIPLPDGDGPVDGDKPDGDKPESGPDKNVVDRLSDSYGADGSSAATVAHLTDPGREASGTDGSGDKSSGGSAKSDGSNGGSVSDGPDVRGESVVAASVSPSTSTLGEFGGAGLLVLVLAIGTLGLLGFALRNRLNHDRDGK